MFKVVHNSHLYVWEMSKYPHYVIFLVKSNGKLLKKLLVILIHHKEDKKLRIALFSWIVFVIILILLDLNEVLEWGYLLIFQT